MEIKKNSKAINRKPKHKGDIKYKNPHHSKWTNVKIGQGNKAETTILIQEDQTVKDTHPKKKMKRKRVYDLRHQEIEPL